MADVPIGFLVVEVCRQLPERAHIVMLENRIEHNLIHGCVVALAVVDAVIQRSTPQNLLGELLQRQLLIVLL